MEPLTEALKIEQERAGKPNEVGFPVYLVRAVSFISSSQSLEEIYFSAGRAECREKELLSCGLYVGVSVTKYHVQDAIEVSYRL